jgi:DNA-binding GntR family transcriptional regulator
MSVTSTGLNEADAPGSGLRGTTYHRVHKAILADIVSGTFAPGARLKIADLCKRYDLSPMPIREALQQLQGEGFVVIAPNRGASVRPIDRDSVANIYEIRGALYTIIYRDVVDTADTALDQKLTQIQKRFDALVEKQDFKGCQELNRLLHATIEARCRNAEVISLSSRYANMTSSLRDLFGYNIDRIREISKEHWRIIEAIRDRDAGRAIAAAQEHVRSALANISQHFDFGKAGQ